MYILIIAVAAFFYAVHETLQHHYTTSIFYGWKPLWFWDPNMWDKSPHIGGYRFDGRHIAASLMIVAACSAAVLGQFRDFQISMGILDGYIRQLALCGVVWILVFNLFFNKLLKK